MYARIPTFRVGSDKIDAVTQRFREWTLPQLQQLPGFKGATMLVDRDRGMFRVVGFWEDQDAVDASEERAKELRRDVFDEAGAELISVEVWEVTVDYYPEAARQMAGAGVADAR